MFGREFEGRGCRLRGYFPSLNISYKYGRIHTNVALNDIGILLLNTCLPACRTLYDKKKCFCCCCCCCQKQNCRPGGHRTPLYIFGSRYDCIVSIASCQLTEDDRYQAASSSAKHANHATGDDTGDDDTGRTVNPSSDARRDEPPHRRNHTRSPNGRKVYYCFHRRNPHNDSRRIGNNNSGVSTPPRNLGQSPTDGRKRC